MALADLELSDVICQHPVEPFSGFGTANDELAHVRDVENADMVSHRLVFGHDAGVLDRHQPSAERDDPGAKPDMFLVKRSALLLGAGHAAKLDERKMGASPVPEPFCFASGMVELLFRRR